MNMQSKTAACQGRRLEGVCEISEDADFTSLESALQASTIRAWSTDTERSAFDAAVSGRPFRVNDWTLDRPAVNRAYIAGQDARHKQRADAYAREKKLLRAVGDIGVLLRGGHHEAA